MSLWGTGLLRAETEEASIRKPEQENEIRSGAVRLQL
jgi:hypothetical protein